MKKNRNRIQIDSKFWPDETNDVAKAKAEATLMYWNVESCWNKRTPENMTKPLRVCDAMKQLSIITNELPITYTVVQKAQYLKTQIIEHGSKKTKKGSKNNQQKKVHVI